MARRWGCLLLVLTLATAGAARVGAAQEAPSLLGQNVTTIRFDVEGREDTSPSLMELADVKVGQPLRQADIRATIAHLDSLGRYENVVPVATAVPGGVEVVFRLTPRHPITRMEIRGETGIPSGDFRTRLLQRYGGVPTTARLTAVEATAEEFLKDEGYLQPHVKALTEVTHDPEGATLILDVAAGEVSRIAHTEIRGDSPLAAAEIIRRTGTAAGATYKRRDIETALTALEDELRARGYYEAQAVLAPTVAADGIHLALTFDTGPRVELRVGPADALPSGDIDALVPIKRVGAADQDLLEDSRARIERALRADGYWRASAPFTRQVSADGKVLTIVFTIARGPRYFVDHVDWPSSLTMPETTLREQVAVREGEVFNQDAFVQSMAKVADVYRRAGYYRVEISPAYEELTDRATATRALVVLHPNITEGPRGQVTNVSFAFPAGRDVPESALRAAMQQRAGRPYVEQEAAQDRVALTRLYRDRGYRSAFVDIVPTYGANGRDVALAITASEGPRVVIGQISVVGNQRVSERAILEELQLALGQPAGDTAISDAQRRLVEMGVFRRVSIVQADQISGENEAHLIVNVVESAATTLGYGGGLEGGRQLREAVGGGYEDYMGFAPRGFFEIGRRNLGGRNRSLNFYSRVALKREVAPGDPTRDGRGFGFTEYRVSTIYRERHAFGTSADLLVGSQLEQGQRTNYNFLRRSVNGEILRPMSDTVSVSARYMLEYTRLFDERIPPSDQPLIDRLFPQVRLSLPSAGVTWDRRNNPLVPTKGMMALGDVELAARALGSEVGYVKAFMQGSVFRAIDQRERTVAAGRVEIGVARGFARSVPLLDADGDPILGPDGTPIVDSVQAIPASQRFYAGGSTTVRGFQPDRLGVPEIITTGGLSLGGNAVVVLNAELRRTLAQLAGRSFGVVGFVDAGNVFATASSLDFTRLRGTSGFGVRYDSPLGPIRMDFGFKMSREIVGGQLERAWEYHLSLGEAF